MLHSSNTRHLRKPDCHPYPNRLSVNHSLKHLLLFIKEPFGQSFFRSSDDTPHIRDDELHRISPSGIHMVYGDAHVLRETVLMLPSFGRMGVVASSVPFEGYSQIRYPCVKFVIFGEYVASVDDDRQGCDLMKGSVHELLERACYWIPLQKLWPRNAWNHDAGRGVALCMLLLLPLPLLLAV